MPASRNGFITFGCLNNFCKAGEETLRLWGRILKAIPNSRLRLLCPPGSHRDGVTDAIGVEPARIFFVPPQRRSFYLKEYEAIDVGLDTFPYNGHTTSLDSLWLGVPVVTLKGRTAVGRGGVSILSNVGLKELIAEDTDRYVEIAVELANDRQRLTDLRRDLRGRMLRSPLMNASLYARDIESAYRAMWRALRPDSSMSEDFQDPNELTRIGLVHVQQGQFELASESFGRAVALRPDSPALWSHLGIALQYAGKSKQAIQAFRKACSLRPDSAELLSNLGNALWQAKEWTEGEAACRKAIELNPDLPDAYANLGNAPMEQDRIDEAVAAFEKFVQLRPKISTGYYNLGLALNKATRSADAAAAFARAVDLNPDDFNSRNNLGCTFLFVSKPEPAAVVFESALKLRPDDAATWNNLGGALKDMGRLPEAIAAYRRAMELRPDVADFHSNLVYCLYYHEPDPEVIYNELKIWNERHCKPLRSRIVPHANERNPQRRLRVGYVSADFWDHASAFFLDPLLANHDHQQFEIFCYAQMNRIDWVTRRLQKYADSWLDTRPFGNDELAQKSARIELTFSSI